MSDVSAARSGKIVPLREGVNQSASPAERSGQLYQGIETAAPTCPSHVSGNKEAKRHWDYMVKVLQDSGMIARLDQGTLAHLCLYYAKAKEAEQRIQQDPDGEFQKTPNGYLQLSPASVVFQRYSSMYNKLADKFLMNPSVRQRVKMENPAQGGLDL